MDPADLYRGQSGHQYHDHKRAVPEVALPWVMESRAAKFQPHIRPADTVLEFGVGSGWNLARLRCARKIGCDAADFLRERVLAAGAEFIRDTSSVPVGSIDVVICHHALEHVLEPAACLASFRNLLRPGGKMILHVPWEHERRYGRYDPAEPNHHLYTWNAQTLGNLVTVCGFSLETVRVLIYGYDRAAASLAARLGLGPGGFRIIRKCLIALFPLREVELIGQNPLPGPKK